METNISARKLMLWKTNNIQMLAQHHNKIVRRTIKLHSIESFHSKQPVWTMWYCNSLSFFPQCCVVYCIFHSSRNHTTSKPLRIQALSRIPWVVSQLCTMCTLFIFFFPYFPTVESLYIEAFIARSHSSIALNESDAFGQSWTEWISRAFVLQWRVNLRGIRKQLLYLSADKGNVSTHCQLAIQLPNELVSVQFESVMSSCFVL